jgi:hypothetical protein
MLELEVPCANFRNLLVHDLNVVFGQCYDGVMTWLG